MPSSRMPRNTSKGTTYYLGLILLLCSALARAQEAEEPTPPDTDAATAAAAEAEAEVEASEPAESADTFEIHHKLSLQGGYGPKDSTLGQDYEPFYGVRYEPSLSWFSPQAEWPVWQGFARAWLNYNSSQASTPFQEQNPASERPQVEHSNAELREFYLKRNLLGGDPRFSLSVGRQRFADHYGIWWDDSLESLRLNYLDDFASGFIAVGQRFYNYNSDAFSLEDNTRSIAYGLGEYSWRWHPQHWAGVRMLLEYDHSGADVDDPRDFKGGRAGLFAHGDELRWGVISDYRMELIALKGRVETIDGSAVEERQNSSGWAFVGDIGKRFDDWPWQPRFALRGGITDKPSNEFDGFGFNDLQSDRVSGRETYSSGMLGSFIGINLRNLAFYGLAVETRPLPRHYFDIRLSDLYLRDGHGELPMRVSPELLETSGAISGDESLGQVLDLNYYWEMFPTAFYGRQLSFDLLLSAGYFKAGDAIRGLDDDYQLSFGAVLRY